MRGGDDEAFREFVVARWNAMLRTAYLLTGDHQLAEDLVQVSLEKVHRHWHRIERRDVPEAYARQVLVHQAVSWSRRRRVREVSLGAAADRAAVTSTDPLEVLESGEVVWQLLSGLPPRMRAVLVLRYVEDLSEADTARLLSCSVGTVKSQASRGLAQLRARLAPDGLVRADQKGTP